MAESFYKLEDETFPSFLGRSLDSDRATLENVTLGSGPGLPVAASTVAKSRPSSDSRGDHEEASYLEGRAQEGKSQSSVAGHPKFSLGFKDDLENTDDFIATHHLTDMLIKISLDGSSSRNQGSVLGLLPTQTGSVSGRPTELGSDLSTGSLTIAQLGQKNNRKAVAVTSEADCLQAGGLDSDSCSGSNSSFLVHEKLMSVDTMNSDVTDDDLDLNNLPDDELEAYFNKLVPPATQRGRVEGQEIPVSRVAVAAGYTSDASSEEAHKRRYQFLNQEDFRMPDVRLAATGMDSCPASDEDTEDELETARRNNVKTRLLPSTSRQLVGESNRPSFRPGLEGGSSGDEASSGRGGPSLLPGIGHRRSAEGQVISSPVAGDGGGGDGSSGSEESGNDGGVSTIPVPVKVLTTYDALRGLGIVGSSPLSEEDKKDFSSLPQNMRNGFPRFTQMGDRVGPVGTGEASLSSSVASHTHWSRMLDRQEALDAMESTDCGPTAERVLDSVYLKRPQDPTNDTASLQSTHGSFHLSQVLDTNQDATDDEAVDEPDGARHSLGPRGGPCGDVAASEASGGASEDDNPLSTSLEAKYFSQSFQQDPEESDEGWTNCPDNMELEFQQGANAGQSVVYQNEEGKWVTDLAYYSNFEKEVDEKKLDNSSQFQNEDFLSASDAMEKMMKDQEEFEKEHQFMQFLSISLHQEEQIEPAAGGNSTFRSDSSWKSPPSSHILMRASQVSSEIRQGDESYLRLSLGQFFSQRSEALGCLGRTDGDDVKRPSFGYIITSPEKREPFPLIQPPDFSFNDNLHLGATVDFGEVDKTLNTEDLDKTLNAAGERLSPKGDPDPEPGKTEDHIGAAMSEYTPGSGSESTMMNQSVLSPDNSSSLMLSISTIASAIANASISTDPSQLAALIVGLSKKSRARSGPESGATHKQAPNTDNQTPPQPDQSTVTEVLQRSICVGETSAFDMEKYLKTNVSGSSDSSDAHTTFNLSSWADGHSSCQKNPMSGCSSRQDGATLECNAATNCGRPDRSSGPHLSLSSARQTVELGQNSEPFCKNDKSLPRASQSWRKSQSGLPLKAPSPLTQSLRSVGQDPQDGPRGSAEITPGNLTTTLPQSSEKQAEISGERAQPAQGPLPGMQGHFPEPSVEETQSNFRPSTSPLTHSSPSQTFIPTADTSLHSPSSSNGRLADRRPGPDLSPESVCSSPSLSRLTYISVNDRTALPTPERQKRESTMGLSTTIIRFSPTPPVEPDLQPNPARSLDNMQQSKSLDPLPPLQGKSPEVQHSGAPLSCTRSQSECSYPPAPGDVIPGFTGHRNLPDSSNRKLTKVDSGYSSNLNIQHTISSAAPPGPQQWGAAPSALSSLYSRGLGMLPPPYTAEALHYVHIPGFKPQCPSMVDLSHKGDVQSILTRRSLVSSPLPLQFLGADAQLHSGAFHMGPPGNGLYNMSSTGSLIPGPAGPHSLTLPHQSRHDMGIMGKPYSHYGGEPMVTGGLEELRGQVVVPEELRFPHACCVGIASQTSLSLFNPSDRWQQVSITVTSLAIDGEKVDVLLYQWLMVKNKTIIGPKSTEEQKVLLVPPQPGVYQCILSVCSWPASAEMELATRANIFAKRVVLIAVAENPALAIEIGESGFLDFGDLPEGSAKSLPLRLLNRTHATVPIRLVISANATAWRCFTLSKDPVGMTPEATQQAAHMVPLASPSVMNHVMHASYGENPESFMVWVHFKAPQKFRTSSEALGPADEYSARVDIEMDSPGPSHIIRSIPLKAKSGTARVHAPKDLQTVSLFAPVGKCSEQTLPLKNAGNIDVRLKLKISDNSDSFSVTPDELCLRVAEEQGVVLSFKAQSSRKCKESLLTVLVLPSGPQYEVTLKGEVLPSDSRNPAAPSAPVCGPSLTSDIPPILSNKQFVAWGGVTLGRAVQQKLVLRNNSTSTTQQLRLLIRGQDQDCFQLQSLFSPEECLTHHGELSIRPREDVSVHLLFAPTRVACMLAKLEIKQSGVRSSQPGVKFIIPLSGYGGTSNIVLEDQRKHGDGYVATLPDVAVGCVSKVCLCVRNTGSRAAFVKAVAFSDIQSRSLMHSSVMSLAPSQFVLKERTQEVITVLMKSSHREAGLCESASSPLATVCLFCGDEVSRQQYRRLLECKPEAGRKALSENSLLKNIDFTETFLGEESVNEAYDLPLRPNEAHIFYSNTSKVLVSLLGRIKSADSEENEHDKPQLPFDGHCSQADGGFPLGSVSLDVLPVKGPQGPSLKVTGSSSKAPDSQHTQSESWIIHPQQLVLTAPTINGPSSTSQVQIQNNTSGELNFDLSWPAHCLTITPQHGVIEPQSQLQILISPNPSLANKSALLPWSGQIYVQCDGQQKFIKVQIRRDLALDVSAAPADASLSALPAQAATPVLPVPRLGNKPPTSAPSLVEIKNKTITFPPTPSGETSEAQLEVQNGEVEVRWYLSSFAPPYVKGVDDSEDVYRATYTAFRCSRVSGTLGAHEKMQVPVTFLPRDRGTYVQFWDMECHPVSEPQQKSRIRFQLSGTGVKSGPMVLPQEGNCSLVRTEATVKSNKRADSSASKAGQEGVRRGVYSPQDLYTFPHTRLGESSTLKVNIRNNSSDRHELRFIKPKEPFHMKHFEYSLRSQHYVKLPVQFKPTTAGKHTGLLLIQSESSGNLVVQLSGEAFL
ncbi:centrosomal protein of 192 kDa isoform X2 [Poecilia formosa]|uniref:centrosomal protein of 192 kDa isoform X2 n=1 Tax=Poecilia formosa TaxID=48698 RepID=UPI0007BAC5CC|nr:PREDICTED: centrosomal protein of 192 kDa isoform X2 [Poecilia formosa]